MKKTKKFLTFIVYLFISIGFFSCSSDITKPNLDNIVIYPEPPDTTRIQFLTSFSSSADVIGEKSSFMEFVSGEEEEVKVMKPYGITIYKGKVYICDTILGLIEIFDFKEGVFEIFQPKGFGKLQKPINCFKIKDGRLFVVDAERTQVVVFDEEDNFLAAFGEGVLQKPTDVFIEDTLIYVADLKGANVQVFSANDYSHISTLPDDQLNEQQKIYQPTNIFVKNKQLYVSDFGQFRVKVYSTDGTFIDSVGTYGTYPGQFLRPKGIAVDDELNLYVVDAGFENVQIFNKSGQLLLFFGGPGSAPGNMWLPAKIIIDYENLEYFEKYVYEGFNLKYLIFVTNQYGPNKINVYGFVEVKNEE